MRTRYIVILLAGLALIYAFSPVDGHRPGNWMPSSPAYWERQFGPDYDCFRLARPAADMAPTLTRERFAAVVRNPRRGKYVIRYEARANLRTVVVCRGPSLLPVVAPDEADHE